MTYSTIPANLMKLKNLTLGGRLFLNSITTMRQSLIIVILILLTGATLNAQNQRIADSLKLVYASDTLNDADRLKVLNGLAFNEINDMPLALSYAEEMVQLSSKLDSLGWLGNGVFAKGIHPPRVGGFGCGRGNLLPQCGDRKEKR